MTEPDFLEELLVEGGDEFRARVDEAFLRRHKIREQLIVLGLLCDLHPDRRPCANGDECRHRNQASLTDGQKL